VAGDAAYLPGMASLGSSDGTDWTATLADAQGSVLATVDAAGVMGPVARYDPYGGPRPTTTLPVGIGFTGEWTDPTALVDLRARVYDPSLQRFLTRDTFGGIPTIPATGNRHAYALGDPLGHTDPSGHFVAALAGLPGGLLDALGIEGPAVAPTTGTSPLCYDIRISCWNGVPLPYEYQPGSSAGGGFDLGAILDLTLDAVGFVPVVGDAVDLVRAGYDAGRWVLTGDPDAIFQAGLNFGAVVPFVGSIGKQGIKHIDDVANIVTGAGKRGAATATSKFGGLANSSTGIASYRTQRALTAGKGGSIQAHHLIEKRFVDIFGGDTADWATVVLTRSEHRVFTNARRQAIPYGASGTGQATRTQIESAARQIYRDYPEILESLGLR
jgi:RHS repeat-associated protein